MFCCCVVECSIGLFILVDKRKENFMYVGPASGLPGKLDFNIYRGHNDSAKPQSIGSISVPSAHCISASLKI